MTEDSPGARKIELHSSEREASIRPSGSFVDSFVEVFKHFLGQWFTYYGICQALHGSRSQDSTPLKSQSQRPPHNLHIKPTASVEFQHNCLLKKKLREFFRQHTDQSIIVLHLCSCVLVALFIFSGYAVMDLKEHRNIGTYARRRRRWRPKKSKEQ